MSEPEHSRMIFRGQAEANPAFSRATDRPFHGWIRLAIVFFVFGAGLLVLNPPIAQPLGVIAAVTFVALGVLATVSAFVEHFIAKRPHDAKARLALRLLGLTIWAGAAVAFVMTVAGLTWP